MSDEFMNQHDTVVLSSRRCIGLSGQVQIQTSGVTWYAAHKPRVAPSGCAFSPIGPLIGNMLSADDYPVAGIRYDGRSILPSVTGCVGQN